MPSGVTSTSIRWLSVPPLTSFRPPASQRFGQRLGVVDDLLGVLLELGLQRFAEADRLAGDDVHQRPALDAGEDAAVDRLARTLRWHEAQARRAGRGASCAWCVVTKSATGTGLSCKPAATRPA